MKLIEGRLCDKGGTTIEGQGRTKKENTECPRLIELKIRTGEVTIFVWVSLSLKGPLHLCKGSGKPLRLRLDFDLGLSHLGTYCFREN